MRRLPRRSGVASDLDVDGRGSYDEDVDVDIVLEEIARRVRLLALTRVIARGTTSCGASIGGGVGAVVEDDFVGSDSGSRGILVSGDVKGEQVTPVVVGHVVDVAGCAFGDPLRADGADVVRFAIVVPGDDFDQFGLQGDDLFPAGGPEAIAAPEPIFVPLGEIGVEPG